MKMLTIVLTRLTVEPVVFFCFSFSNIHLECDAYKIYECNLYYTVMWLNFLHQI